MPFKILPFLKGLQKSKIWSPAFLSLLQLSGIFFTSGCSGLFYAPDRALHADPRYWGGHPDEILFQAKEGPQLYGWFFRARHQPALGTLVQFHGNAQNMSSHYLSLFWITLQGYNLFTFDYRGYGKSLGTPDQRGTVQDGEAALQEAWKLHTPNTRFVVYGQSLGGAIALRALAHFENQAKIDLVVMDSTFASYSQVARSILARNGLTWIFSPLAGLLVSNEYGIEQALENNRIPMLVIHDEKDPIVPYQNGQEIFSKNRGAKQFWTLNQGLHVGIFNPPSMSSSDETNRKKFLKFLNELPTQFKL